MPFQNGTNKKCQKWAKHVFGLVIVCVVKMGCDIIHGPTERRNTSTIQVQ